MKKRIQIDIVKYFESIYSWVILMLIFSVYYLDFIPNSNEENYFQLAKAFFEPDWIKNSFILTESSGTRALYQYIVGFFLGIFSIEQVVFIFRFFFIVAYSVILHKIYKSLKIKNIMIVLHLVILYLGKQAFFAGSWIFITAEAKAFAYLFIFLALYFTIQKRYNFTILFLILATYFHILIGFYAFVYMALSILILERWDLKTNYKLILKLSVYFIAVLPFVLVLYNNIDVPANLKPNADWIYTWFRNPHHTTLINGGFSTQLKGIIFSFVAMLTLIYMRRKDDADSRMQTLYIIGIVTFAGTLLSVPFIFFDKNGTFLKFYLFRINAFSTLIFVIALSKWLYKIIKEEYRTIGYIAIIFLAAMQLGTVALHQYDKVKSYNDFSYNEVCEYIRSKTDKSSVILGLFDTNRSSLSNEEKYSLTRKTERDRFVVFKFVPADLNKIHEWYNRVKIKDDIAKDIDNLVAASVTYKIDYVMSNLKYDKEFLEPVFNNDNYFLYKVRNVQLPEELK